MKRSISNIIASMFLVLTLAILIPFVNTNAMTSNSGNGTEENPHQLTIGYCENDAFTYNPNSGFCYLSVTFAANVEVSVSFPQTGPWVMIKRAGGASGNISDGMFLAKQGETVNILIRSGSSSNPICFTSKALSDISRYCSISADGQHDFDASHGVQCNHGCGYTCTHPKASRAYYNDYVWLSDRTHAQRFECKICGVKTHDDSDAEACILTNWTVDNNYDRHHAECTVCGNSYTDTCTFTAKEYKKSTWDKHILYYTCSVCGQAGSSEAQAHTFKNGTCTKCGFVRIVPGKTKISSAKQSGKVKVKTTRYKGHYNWNTYYYRWEYIKPSTKTTYSYKIQVKYKKVKNAARYIISTSKNINNPYLYSAGKNKTSVTCTYTTSKKKSSVTLYVTPVSKTGTPGKSVKKVVRLKN